MVGKPLPTFHMPRLGGGEFNNENLRGKVFVLDFWASWCTTCRLVSPVMQQMHTKYGTRATIIGADSYENPGTKGAAARYRRQHSYTYSFAEHGETLADKIGASGLPTVFVVGKDGKVAAAFPGYAKSYPAAIDRAIREALAKS